MGLPSYDGYALVDRPDRPRRSAPGRWAPSRCRHSRGQRRCDGDRDRGQPRRRAPSGRSHGLPAAGGPTCSVPGAGPRLRPLGCVGRELSGLAAEQIAQGALPGQSRASARTRCEASDVRVRGLGQIAPSGCSRASGWASKSRCGATRCRFCASRRTRPITSEGVLRMPGSSRFAFRPSPMYPEGKTVIQGPASGCR